MRCCVVQLLQLIDQEEEKDVFIMLVDRSKSMDTPDAVAKTFKENKVISRDDVLKKYLTQINAGDGITRGWVKIGKWCG